MQAVKVDFRFAYLMQRIQRVVQTVEPHDSVEVDTAEGTREISARSVIITKAKAFRLVGGEKHLVAEHGGETIDIVFDEVLVAVGRAANSGGYGAETTGVELSGRGTIAVNPFMQNNYPNIFACGDVAGPCQFTRTAAHTAW